MPNIIEQQDLLKGLPDARLAMLMKQPDASIPPFLVAAEAQRRQAIRQQFAGDGQSESVVDTLTKQMANVPQNIQAPMQTPPNIPAPQQQAGIGALPQGQQMANGGPVRRFASDGYVKPMWKIPSYPNAVPQVMDWVGSTAKSAYDYATTGWGDQKDTPDNAEDPAYPDISSSLPDKPIPKAQPGFATTGQPSPYTDLTPKKPDPTVGTNDTSAENKAKAKEAEFRQRIKELYGADESSNWEDAQKWFAMSAQFLDGNKNLMQSVVGAANEYASAEAQQAQDARAAKRDEAEALLKYDMGLYEDEQARSAAGVKARTDLSTGQMDDIRREQDRLYSQLDRIQESVDKGEITPEIAAQRQASIQARIDSLGAELSGYKQYIQSQYGFQNIPTVDLKSGTIK